MGPPESAEVLAPEAVELHEPVVRLADPASPGEEQEDVEAADVPGRGRCWPCGAWACGSRGEPEAKKKAPCPGLGLFYTVLSAFLFSVASLFVKKVQGIHAVEISAFRCVIQMLVIIPCLIYRKTGFIGPKGQRLFLLFRGIFGSSAMILMYYAFQTTSLADATVIAFSCPVFTSIFAWIFLKEKYSLWDAFFTLFAIVGVILIVRPPFLFGSDTFGAWSLAASTWGVTLCTILSSCCLLPLPHTVYRPDFMPLAPGQSAVSLLSLEQHHRGRRHAAESRAGAQRPGLSVLAVELLGYTGYCPSSDLVA